MRGHILLGKYNFATTSPYGDLTSFAVTIPPLIIAGDLRRLRRIVTPMIIHPALQAQTCRRTATGTVCSASRSPPQVSSFTLDAGPQARPRGLQTILITSLAIKAVHLVEASRVLATVVAPLVHLRRLINPRDLVETRGNTLAMVAMNLLATGDSKNL
jgi:hypothetical protein